MRVRDILIAASMGITLTNCANTGNVGNLGDFCQEEPLACILGVGAIVAGVILISNSNDDDNGSSEASDLRLKRDVHEAGMLPNGIKLYTFHYWNDDRVFLGVMAQDLLADPRFADAVTQHESGYYLVDLGKLGLGLGGDAQAFREASQNALKGL